MSAGYRAVLWNRNKRRYDLAIAVGALLFLCAFVGIGLQVRPQATVETLLIRGFGVGALLLLHLVLAIGPLCRLFPRFLPLLYNRRHLGVCMFLLGAAHGGFAIVQFHGFGVLNPLVSVLASNGDYDSLTRFPFQSLGLAALAILFLMAATSHDFWLANLTAPVWKSLHMLVYAAYALVIAHVVLGSLLREDGSFGLPLLMGAGLGGIVALHLGAAWHDRPAAPAAGKPGALVDVCAVSEIPLGRARIFLLSGERAAVFRYRSEGGERIAAVSNVCQHQNGPLGEGRVIDGCITCPWHGYQYRPEDGRAPAPFTEKIPTFNVRIEDGRVLVDPRPNPPGAYAKPAVVPTASRASSADAPSGRFSAKAALAKARNATAANHEERPP